MKLYLNLTQYNSTTTLHLDGASAVAPVKGTFYKPGVGKVITNDDGEMSIEEELKVSLSGTRDQILSLLETLSRLLEMGARKPLREWDALYLKAEYAPGNVWRSQIVGGWVEGVPAGLAARELGGEVLKLHLTRKHYWEANDAEGMKLTNRSGTRQAMVTVYNHTDATSPHDNFLEIVKDDISGDLPAPITVDLAHLNAGRTISQVWIGQFTSPVTLPAWLPVYEAEAASAGAGVTLTPTADAASSAGNFARLAWTAGAEARVLSFPISYLHMPEYAGRMVKPVLRLANNHAYPDLWLKAKVTYGAGNSVAYDTPWVKCEANTPVISLGALRLPPYPANANFHDSLNVSIYAMKTTGAAVTLDLDFMQLTPTDGINRLDMIEPIAAGYHIQEGEGIGSYKWDNVTMRALPSHARVGLPLRVTPGMNTRLFFLHSAGASMPIDTTLDVALYYRKRKRDL